LNAIHFVSLAADTGGVQTRNAGAVASEEDDFFDWPMAGAMSKERAAKTIAVLSMRLGIAAGKPKNNLKEIRTHENFTQPCSFSSSPVSAS
jgi:hypothetical protein